MIDKENILICEYGTRTWKSNEQSYDINEKEVLAIQLGIKGFYYHLLHTCKICSKNYVDDY